MTQSEIVKKIIHLEEKYNLLSASSAKVNKWPFYRVYFFKKICVELGITQDIKKSNNRKLININTLLSLFKNINLHVFFHGECEDLFFCSQRLDSNNNEIYCSEFIKKSSSYKIISQTQNFKFIQGFYYLDFWKSAFTAISVLWSRLFSSKEDEVFMNLCHDLGLDSHQQKKMVTHMRQYYFIYNLWHLFYKNVLKKIKPKKIYLVGGIFYAPLVNVADAMNIDTIEIQHGVINKKHLGYHFPKTSRDGYFSKELYLLSNFWKEKASLPSGVKTIQTGNNYFYKKPTFSNKKNGVLFISGPRFGDKVAEIAISFAEKNKGVPISFKLHPREIKDWKTRYKKLHTLHQRKLIEMNPDFYIELDDAYSYSNRGLGKLATMDYHGAIFDFNKAIEKDNNYATAYYLRGSAKFKLSKLEDAISDFNKAIEINPYYYLSYRERGEVKLKLGDISGSEEDLNKAKKIEDKNKSSIDMKELTFDYKKVIDSLNR